MEFWGVEVKPGESVKCDPGFNNYILLTQAALSEGTKSKGAKVILSVKNRREKVVIGTLVAETLEQWSFDLVFGSKFKLSIHGNTGVFFLGRKILDPGNLDYKGDVEGKAGSAEVETSIKKTTYDSATKNPGSGKKAKLATPSDSKTGGKRGSLSKAGAKTPHNSKHQSPVAQVSYKSCTKKFNSEAALHAHAKVKHGSDK